MVAYSGQYQNNECTIRLSVSRTMKTKLLHVEYLLCKICT